MAAKYTHRESGWTRESLADGSMCWRVGPADGSEPRIVRFLSAHSWQNDPADDRANAGKDRVVLISGPELPPWTVEWLQIAVRKSSANGRLALRAAIDDADWNEDRRNADSY